MKILVIFSLFVLTTNAAEFTKTRARADSGGTLLVSWRETGLSPESEHLYKVKANATANYWCIDTGERHPTAKATWEVISPVESSGGSMSSKSGTVSGELSLSPPSGPTGVCGAGESLVLHDVTYEEIGLENLTSSTSASIPGSFSVLLFGKTFASWKKVSTY